MLSCDTFALTASHFEKTQNFFAKNSDRPLGESQPIVFFPHAEHNPGAFLQCTHLRIPQVGKTYAVMGCQPYWIWGFEMGLNECGLVIGNEAQGSRCAPEQADGLLGMDLLRLGLERAATAREAICVITDLLAQYGQNANASMLFDRRYESSYILSDPREVWLLETAGREWVAKKIRNYVAISNCYSIGTDYDLCSKNMESLARENRWLAPDESMDFAKAYTIPAPRQGYSVPRWRRLRKLIGSAEVPLSVNMVKAILRDHFEGELTEPRFGCCYGTFNTICMHSMTWDAGQTTASLLCHWDDVLGPICLYAPSLPCCSVYLPVYWTGTLPQSMTVGCETYRKDSLWWQTERLAMAISIDEARFRADAVQALSALEVQLQQMAAETQAKATALIRSGDRAGGHALLTQLTQLAADRLMDLVCALADNICKTVADAGGLYGPRKDFLEAYCKRTNLPLS